ncbi:MAG: DUF3899 domain-containing protein [Bacillales bacterium]|jgi:hypothetical protein|nr:DUF3899 domain-containing protein [Bacillales bacterium]
MKVFRKYLITVIVAVGIGVGVFFISPNQENQNVAWINAFFVPGILLLLFSGLIFVSQQGAFDMLAFALKKLFEVTFTPKKMSQTFYEYKLEKESKERMSTFHILIVGIVFLLIWIIIWGVIGF